MFYFSLFLRKNFSFYSKLLLQIKKTIYIIHIFVQNCWKQLISFCKIVENFFVMFWVKSVVWLFVCGKLFLEKKNIFLFKIVEKKILFCSSLLEKIVLFCSNNFFSHVFVQRWCLNVCFWKNMFIMFSFFKKSHLRYFFYILVLVKKFNFVVVWKFVFIISQKGVILVFYFYFSLILKTIFSFYSKLLFEIVMFPCERIISVFAGFIASPLLY